MADLVLGAGMSHSPVLCLEGADWIDWGEQDRESGYLFDESGRRWTWADRVAEVADRFVELATVEKCVEAKERTRLALDELATRVATAKLDAIVVIGDDQDEHLFANNLPPLLVYWGDTI